MLFVLVFCLLSVLTSCDLVSNTIEYTDEVYTGLTDSLSYYTWDSSEVVVVALNTTSALSISSEGVSINGSTVTITAPGTYQLSGTLSNGQIIVNSDASGIVRLLLDGVNITCSNSSPVYIKDADEVYVHLAENSVNYLTDGTSYVLDDVDAGEPNAALFSKSDLIIGGTGSLLVDGNYLDGIASKDGLLIKSGTIGVTAADDALRGRDCLTVKGGTITVTSVGDGLVSTNDEDLDWGYVTMDSCTVKVVSGGDAIAAVGGVIIDGGTYNLTSGGGSSTTTTESAKGIKSGQVLMINDGTFAISSADDALHAAGALTVNKGTLTLSSGDDGIHSDESVTLNDGTLTLSKSYEGIEAPAITINDGTWSVTASNDCVNASMGTVSGGTESNDGSSVVINGGTLMTNMTGTGDGIDSNGTLVIKGGTVIVQGPSSQPEVALDINGAMAITGGTLIACGPNSGSMIQPTSSMYASSSTQYCLVVGLSSTISSSSYFNIQDASGNSLVTFKPNRTAYYFVFSSPELKSGSTYSVYTGGTCTGATVTNGWYPDGTYTGGTLQKSLTLSSTKLVSTLSSTTGGGSTPGGH
jgi:hypothetical protein